jgi:hypothetical protein
MEKAHESAERALKEQAKKSPKLPPEDGLESAPTGQETGKAHESAAKEVKETGKEPLFLDESHQVSVREELMNLQQKRSKKQEKNLSSLMNLIR